MPKLASRAAPGGRGGGGVSGVTQRRHASRKAPPTSLSFISNYVCQICTSCVFPFEISGLARPATGSPAGRAPRMGPARRPT